MEEQNSKTDNNAQEKDQVANNQDEIILSEENINQLIKEAISGLGPYRIYDKALSYIDIDSLKSESSKSHITTEQLSVSFSVAGFAAGIKYALSNIMINPAE